MVIHLLCVLYSHWMASAARNGEFRVVEDALVHKRFWPGMTSRVWTPGTRREARRLLVWHTAQLTEFAWSLCGTDADRQQLIMAAWMRLWGLGLNWGVTNSGRVRPWSRRVLTRRLLQSLSGPSAQFARSRNFSAMLKQISLDEGVVGASRLARVEWPWPGDTSAGRLHWTPLPDGLCRFVRRFPFLVC